MSDTQRLAAMFNLTEEQFTTGQPVRDGRILRPAKLEADLQRELMRCPECERDVHTKAAEGVPAQSLRACDECGAVFFMDLDSIPHHDN